MSSVTVVWQGHREEIKIASVREPLRMSVLEEALRRFQLLGTKSEYALRRSRARKAEANVDLGIDWMHSGLMNKCDLDLISVAPRRGMVRVGVTCDDGTKFTASADCSKSMSDTFIVWRNESKLPKRRVERCTVLRQDLDIERPLSSLGYGPGASFRAELFLGQENTNEDTPMPPVPISDSVETDRQEPPPAHNLSPSVAEKEVVMKREDLKALDDAVVRLTPIAAKTISKYISALLNKANVPAISLENNAFKTRVASSDGGLETMYLAGWSVHHDTPGYLSISTTPDTQWLELILDRLRAMISAPTVKADQSIAQESIHTMLPPSGFDPYRSTRFNLGARGTAPPPVTSAETAPERDLRLLRAKRSKLLANAPTVLPEIRIVDRRLMTRPNTVDHDDASNRRADAAALRAAIASRSRKKNTESPLTTLAARQLETLQSAPLYHAVRLKVLFEDHKAIALSFSTLRTVADLKLWLETECFDNGGNKFELYELPKAKIDPAQSLSDLAPAAVLRVYPAPILKPSLSMPAQPQDDPALYPKPLIQQTSATSSTAANTAAAADSLSSHQARTASQGGLPDRRDPPPKKPFSWLKTG